MDQDHEDYADPGSRPPPQWVKLAVIAVVALSLLAAVVAFLVLEAVASGPRFD